MKGLRGTALDPFGRTEERKTERALIVEYRQCIETLLKSLTADTLALEFPTAEDGAAGMDFVEAAIASRARDGGWVSL